MDLMDPCRCSSAAAARGELQGRISDVEEGRFGVVALSCCAMSAKLGRASGSSAHARRISSRMSSGMVFGMSGRARLIDDLSNDLLRLESRPREAAVVDFPEHHRVAVDVGFSP